MSEAEAKNKIAELVEKYEQVKKSGQIKKYTEEDTKKGFIVPLFQALGWDFEDRDEVSSEEHVQSSGFIDYGFYLNGAPKFYLEAKKLSADIHAEDFAKQAIRYSWNRGVTWAVLTDFESLLVFYAQSVSKHLGDKLYFEITYDKYLERFDELWRLSKEDFKDNVLDQEAEKSGKKYQKISVTDTLYKDLNESRGLLLKSFHEWNTDVPDDLLDEGVQKMLDRLIFMRVAEDRKLENPILLPMLRMYGGSSNKDFFKHLVDEFRKLDDVYNSNLFAPHPLEEWEEYSGKTGEVIEKLYGNPGYYEYDFKAIPADILGSVYENYLGYKLSQSEKGIEVSKDARKRKEQGIYYTPTYIVDYIVANALKPVLDKCQSVQDLKNIKVLDPACGSGSFLIRAMEMIYQKYLEFGANPGEMTKITILLDNIFGVDLDEQAVEIARLNLLINALDSRMKLPDLSGNIKNGNSLISGTDAELKKAFGKDYRDKKPFNWQEQFPQVFERKNPGFDVIIGNPPYIKEYVSKEAFDGLRSSPYYQGKMDIWTLFSCQAIDLLRQEGTLSFIAPNNWTMNAGASIFRNKILLDGELISFIDFADYKVFDGVGIQTMIFVFHKCEPRSGYPVSYARIDSSTHDAIQAIKQVEELTINPEKLIDKTLSFSHSGIETLLEKIASRANFELDDAEVAQGIVAAPDKLFLTDGLTGFNKDEQEFLKLFHTSVGRYTSGSAAKYLFYISAKNFTGVIKDYPNIMKHFEPHKNTLIAAKIKYGTPDKPYFFLHRERDEIFFKNGPKIISATRTPYPKFLYTEKEYYGSRALFFLRTDRANLKYLTGILNSRLIDFWLHRRGKRLGDLLQVDKGPLLKIPLFVPPISQQQPIIELVDKQLNLNAELDDTNENSNKWHALKSETEKSDHQIDQLVYKLYGLTPEEIKTIESGA